jgi:hypothetical protein
LGDFHLAILERVENGASLKLRGNVNNQTETKPTSSKEEDSFEQARQTFFGTGRRIIKSNLASADFSEAQTTLPLLPRNIEHILGGSKND